MLRRLMTIAVGLLPLAAAAQERPIAFSGATIIPIAGAPIENGTLVIHRGKVVAVGQRVAIPDGAQTRDLSGRTIMPGLVDTHSHIGQVAGADASAPIQPEVRALDSINIRHSGIYKARAGGVTTVNVMPGSGHLLSGQTMYLKLRGGTSIEDLAIRTDDGEIAGGIKMANGTNPIRTAPFPGTRGKSAALMRAQLIAAQEYCVKMGDEKIAADKRPARYLGKEALCDVLSGKRIVHHHTHRHDDIQTVLRLAKEFGFRVVLQHASDAWMVAEEIAAAKVPASIIILDSPGGKLETATIAQDTGAILEKAGVLIAYHTDDPIVDSRMLLRSAALGVRSGLSRETALASLTLNGAKMLDLDARVGSLEAGKDADFIVLDGDPLSVYTQVQETWVEGVRLFDRANPADALFATGGYGAGREPMAGDVLQTEAAQ
jgi:imidazolonepropionase-like amidohydrolase